MSTDDEEIRDALKAALEMLEKHPPIEVRGSDRPHSGEHDCASCGYPLTGRSKRPDLPTHENYRKKSWNGDLGQRCDYIQVIGRIQSALSTLSDREEREREEQDIVTAVGGICITCGKGDR